MGPTWVLSALDGPHVIPMNIAIRVYLMKRQNEKKYTVQPTPEKRMVGRSSGKHVILVTIAATTTLMSYFM